MLRNIFKNRSQHQEPAAPLQAETTIWEKRHTQQPRAAEIDRLFVSSRQGLWAVLIFLAVSMVAYYFRDQTLTGCLSTAFRAELGPAPPEILIDILQVVSTFSSLILIAGRIYDGRLPGNTWMHLGFRLVFYPLYFIADCMGAHFDFVFVSGLVVLALQHYNFWNFSSLEMENRVDSKVMG